ncbi:MAG: hypothetical protein Ctma_1160 [Catillopecten margaritatus gill symbiont]|uniref:Transcriptional regulator n=1 Tax=Catillopecten margaritatus gill symbiont TaxID=3083288 RepID=A0AAU6PHE1_9GAMM
MTTEKTTAQQPMELVQETYVDGVASIGIRQNVAKIDFYQASPVTNEEGTDDKQEFRKVSHRLVLPMAGLLEIHEILDKIIKENQENIEK